MGKYGYKFIGTDGIAMNFCEEHDKSLSDNTQDSNETQEETVAPQCSTDCVITSEKELSPEKELADCISKLTDAVENLQLLLATTQKLIITMNKNRNS